ncbi:8602_t:CDS:1, partial [Gigaspora rosea]
MDNTTLNDTPSETISTQFPTNFSLSNGINIVTHNIRGITNTLKMQNWIEYCHENNLHIISITETKLTNLNATYNTNPHYFL